MTNSEQISKPHIPWNKGVKGIKLSEEHKKHISEGLKGRICSEETRRKIMLANKGKKISEEHKDKLRKMYKGIAFFKGRKHTEESKMKMSLAQKGRKGWSRGLKLSSEHRKNLCLAQQKRFSRSHSWLKGKKNPYSTGENNWNWKGGITPVNAKIRGSLEYRLWRDAVFTRDNYTCIWCGIHSGMGKAIILHADHIKPFADYPELRFSIDNGRTLCLECHKKTDTYLWKNHKQKL